MPLRVMLVGGTGRVGSAVARRLLAARSDATVGIVGRRAQAGQRIASELGARATFFALDATDRERLGDLIRGADLVINAAGPFQEAEPQVLEAAIRARTRYLDIADDIRFTLRAKALHNDAVAAGVPALVCGGIFPGLSNVMAGALVEEARARSVSFSYFVVGTGGAGPAVMASTFLLSRLPATEFVDGNLVERRAFTGRTVVEFPQPVGKRSCFYLELPEVMSCATTYGVPSVVARFGTAPALWNYSTRALGALPHGLLESRRGVEHFTRALMPLLRLTDRFVGAQMAMRVDVGDASGALRSISYAHSDTVTAIAEAVSAQVDELITDRVRPGVWWPEQAIVDKRKHLRRATAGAIFGETRSEMN